MKQLDTPQPMLLVTIGTPGTGKSTFAGQLAKQHNVAWIHTNRLRATLFPQPTFSRDEETAIDDFAEHILTEMLRTKGNIIYDGNANTRASRSKLTKLAREAGYKVLLVWLQTDPETARARAAKRGTRPQDDRYATALSADGFEFFANKLAKPWTSEDYVVISGKHAFPTQARTLMTKISTLFPPKSKPAPKPIQVQPKQVKEVREITDKDVKRPKPKLPSVEDIHHAQTPKERSKPRFDITRHIKFR